MVEIRIAKIEDVHSYRQHLIRHGAESGNDGDLIFAPFDEPFDRPEEELRGEKSVKWVKSISEPGWERCWIIVNNSNVHGALKLVHQPPLTSALHRATLMMGIERSHRSQGWGSRLITQALSWARQQPPLEWIDLYVFAHNAPARGLYTKAGFKEIGKVPDLFRVKGQKIDDIHMVLNLRE